MKASKRPAWNVTKFEAVVKFPDRMDLLEKFDEVYYNDGEEAATAFYEARQAEMDQGAGINWPGVQTLLFLSCSPALRICRPS